MGDRRGIPWTIREVLSWTKEHLASRGVENARLETEWILSHALGTDRVGLYVAFDKPLTDPELGLIREMVRRRARREPLQYILGTQEFAGLEFVVTPHVLIPRHDTETLLKEALSRLCGTERVLDVGTGSGCLAVSLARHFPSLSVTAVDISADALAVARENARRNGVFVRFLQGDLFAPCRGETFHMVVSNPPYIPSNEIESLQPEVRDHEPRSALDGGSDGLELYRRLVPEAVRHLSPGGWLLVETGIGEGPAVRELFASAGFCDMVTAVDPSGIERVVVGRLKAKENERG